MKELVVILVFIIAGLLVLYGKFLPFSDAAHTTPLKDEESAKKLGG